MSNGVHMKSHHVRKVITCLIVIISACRIQAQTTWYSNFANPLAYNVLEPSVIYDSSGRYFTMWFLVPSYGIMKAVSSDGFNWFYGDSLVLAPGELGAFDHFIHTVNVVRHGGDYLMYYAASRNGDSTSIGLAISPDGNHWQKSPSSPVLTHGQTSSWDARSVAGSKVCVSNGMFMMWYTGTHDVYGSTGLATSIDGISWTKDYRNPVLRNGNAGKVDARQADVMGVTNRDSLYYMIYLSIDSSGVYSSSLATSADGANWTKYFRNPVKIGSGWDRYAVGGGTLLWLNGLFRLWYCGTAGGSWALGEAVSEPAPLQVEESRESSVSAASLLQNYPNPFNPNSEIRYQISEFRYVKLAVYDLLGREVAVLVNERKAPGSYEVRFDGSNLASGVYFYRMQAGDFVQTKRLILLK
jgi:predicted GH43/DUF377 family glycosyl hydrolase